MKIIITFQIKIAPPPFSFAENGGGGRGLTFRDVPFTVVRLVEPRLVLSRGEGWSLSG